MNIFEKVARRITRRSWNRTVHRIILDAMKRDVIDSHQAHAILGAWNRECFPEEGHTEYLKAVEHRLSHVKIARYWKKGVPRWRWSLYYSPYSGHGVRFVRLYQTIHRRWYMFFDLPVVGGLELYIQDIP